MFVCTVLAIVAGISSEQINNAYRKETDEDVKRKNPAC
jgi:hypothetical protein